MQDTSQFSQLAVYNRGVPLHIQLFYSLKPLPFDCEQVNFSEYENIIFFGVDQMVSS